MLTQQVLHYSVFYQHDPEGGFVASVPLLPGCHTQGETLEEAKRNVREAIEVYLESLREHGEEIPVEQEAFHGTVEISAATA